MCQPISRKMFQKDQKLKVKARADGDLEKNVQNARLANVLDADIKITKLLNFKIHLNRRKNGKRRYIPEKEVIVHQKNNATTAIITTTK